MYISAPSPKPSGLRNPGKNRKAAIARARRLALHRDDLDDGPEDRLLLPLTLRPASAADLGAASESHAIAEWGLVWVTVSDCLKW